MRRRRRSRKKVASLRDESEWGGQAEAGGFVTNTRVRSDFLDEPFCLKESEIKRLIDSRITNQHDAGKVHRKLLSVIDDYDKRNEAVHCGELLTYSGLSNYDSLITTLKELVEILFENNLFSKK